ncbi:hypothetical protein EOD39_12813 [Acipenser ruthenus]|uniref:Uncharacterized protein n=1 Tax=Acipenser ruthenus TaxID=7906 RepID=A0A662YPK6_ACIRT|nr:hypothetical protein EOD39_12813 [Acipenser ruthenus]
MGETCSSAKPGRVRKTAWGPEGEEPASEETPLCLQLFCYRRKTWVKEFNPPQDKEWTKVKNTSFTRSSKVGPLNPLHVHKNRESAGPDPIIDSQLADILQYQKQSFSWAIAREEISPNEHEESNQKPREVRKSIRRRQREMKKCPMKLPERQQSNCEVEAIPCSVEWIETQFLRLPANRDWQPPGAVVPTGPEEEEEEELQSRAPIPRYKAAGDSIKCDRQSRPGKQN